MHTLPIEELLTQVDAIPPLPELAQELLQICDTEDYSAADIAELVSRDASITAKVLGLANSPLYAPEIPITQIPRAVAQIGARGITHLVLGICAQAAMRPRAGSERVHEFLWSHSVAVATLAEDLARSTGERCSEELFTAGMFSNLGFLALITLLPGSTGTELFDEIASGEFEAMEISALTEQCQELGARVLEAWKIPESLRQLVRPGRQEPVRTRRQLLLLARDLAECKGWWFYVPSEAPERVQAACAHLRIAEADLRATLARMRERFGAVSESLGCDGVLCHPQRAPDVGRVRVFGGAAERSVDLEHLILEDCSMPSEVLPMCEDIDLAPGDVIVLRDYDNEFSARLDFGRRLVERGARHVLLLGLADQTLRIDLGGAAARMYALPRHPRVSDYARTRILEQAPLRQGSLREVLERHLYV